MLTQSSKSAHWRLVRKGVAPAFSQQNMRRDCSGRCALLGGSAALPEDPRPHSMSANKCVGLERSCTYNTQGLGILISKRR